MIRLPLTHVNTAISQIFTESVGIMRKQQANIEKMQSEIRVLQVENQRILHRIFGENNSD
jgi:hypothetical protein